ncbi:MAG: hypothetical protein ACRDOB_22100 [Streptosporangiaceae bacterium]
MAEPQAQDERPRRGGRGRRAAALLALILGLAGLAASVIGVAIQVLPRHFTAGQEQQIEAWEVSSRWQELTAGKIFPASVTYQLPAAVLYDTVPLNLAAARVGIAAPSGCSSGVTAAAAAVLRRDGCLAVLRATYADATQTYVMTVGVAVLPSATAAASAARKLSVPQLTSAHAKGGTDAAAAAGVLVVRFRGSAAGLYDYSRQVTRTFADGPYLIMYAAGYTDSRPQVRVSQDSYSYAEMTSLASGVAQSVANTLAAAPPPPHCPGSPGC